jgi:DNA polymerase-3 subunit beta
MSPLVLSEKTPHVNFHFQGEVLKMHAPSQGHGEARDEVLINYNGPEISLTLNLRYLLDIVSRLKETEVQIDLESSNGGIIIKDMQNPSTFCILMTMR